jgi:hypothetical protein
MSSKGVNFLSMQTGIREFYPANELGSKTFEDIAGDLYGKLLTDKGQPIKKVMRTRLNELQEEHRVGLIKFFYLKDEMQTPIAKAETVVSFYLRTGANEVLFFIDVIGGSREAESPKSEEDYSHYQFLAHIKPLLADATRYGEWKLREYAPNRFRLIKTVRDKYRRLITVVLQANTGYPRRPPRVVTLPKLRDPCFQNGGELNWTVVAGENRFTWELYMKHENPLIYLLDELKTKYGLVF